MEVWTPRCRATLVGSMPHRDRKKALKVIFETVPEIPVWPQLSAYPAEGMMVQFLEGLPGLREENGRVWVRTDDPRLDEEVLAFFEEYLAVDADPALLRDSRFAMGQETARTFNAFLETLLEAPPDGCVAVKGQIVGPFTLLTGLTDSNRKALLYDDRMREVILKHLAMKARWQVDRLQETGRPVILFLDEPALAGFGTSAYITISADDVVALLKELVEPLHASGAVVGIHVCANTDWGLVYRSGVDVINFDAYQYFDRFALYRDEFFRFLDAGGVVAWGMVPTADPDAVKSETVESLAERWKSHVAALCADPEKTSFILERSLITPSCGCGTLSEELAERVAALTRDLAAFFREREL